MGCQRNIPAMTLKGAIFDADGTLLDSMHIWRELGARYLQSLNITPEKDLSRVLYPMSLEQSCRYLKEHYGLRDSEGEIQRGILGIIEGFYRDEVILKDGVKGFLEGLRCKNIHMVIATSGNRELLSSALERNDIAGYFDEIFTCSELATTKHEPDIFMACAEFLGLEPGNVGVFEDALFAVEAAKRAGFVVIGVADDSNIHEREMIRATADYFIENFTGGITQ
ncbi:MAG: HAD family phosphatase [Synergistaceae bacterium]|nr:HAD family phosphatase [Synergistaceae bacterium]